MPEFKPVYTLPITVGEADIDLQGRVSNLRFVAWMQDVAVAHSTACGWPLERYAARSEGWVVRQHSITYKRPAVLGDVLTLATWVADFASRHCHRRYVFWRQADKAVLAEAETQWVYIDMASGKALRIPEELRQVFPAHPVSAAAVFHALAP